MRALHFVLIAALFIAVGCGGRQTPAPDDALSDPIALYEAMLSRMEAVDTVRLGAMLEYYGDQGRARVEQGVIARAPHHLRMDTLSPFGTTLSVFILNDGQLIFYDLNERLYASGPAHADNVARFVPFYLTADDLIRVLLGGAPLDVTHPDPDTYTMEWDGRAGAYALTMPMQPSGTITLFVRHQSWTLAGAVANDADGDRVFELRTGDFTTVATADGDTEMPQRMRFLMPSEDLDISLEVTRIEMDVTIPDTAFGLPAPAGAEVITLP